MLCILARSRAEFAPIVHVAGMLAGMTSPSPKGGPGQSVIVLASLFLSMACNFGYLLMAMDRLRSW